MYFCTFLCLFFSLVAIPVYVKHSISFKENSSCGRFDITIGPKQNMGKTIEGITVTVHMPKVVLNMNLTPTQGSYTFDPVTKVQALRNKNEQVFCNLFCGCGWRSQYLGSRVLALLKQDSSQGFSES
jgi:hypothetical protein